MSPAVHTKPVSIGLLPQLAAAPHRMMFFAGATAVMVSMLWWALVLARMRFGWAWMPEPPIVAGVAHATMTQFGMLPMFIFGFLLTVFPRWMDQPPLTQRDYVPVFVGALSGYVISHVGLLGSRLLLVAGLVLMLAGWSWGVRALASVLRRDGWRDRHAISCLSSLVLGMIGLSCVLAYVLGAPERFARIGIRVGTFGLLLPIFFAVCHRMLPFFSKAAVRGYRVVRPTWSLPLFWPLVLAHLGIDAAGYPQWLWMVDAPLAALFLWHAIAWQPWKAMRPGLLAVLHLAFAWLPVAFIMFAVQSLVAWSGEGPSLGRAPMHALTVGFFGSMLVAMVTRVTQGHSGRPLVMPAIPWLTFVLMQCVAVMRIGSEFTADVPLWLTLSAFAWLVAFSPWAVRAILIYLRPRADGQPG
ncbi:MAG: NnrS family protein [Gammaproteobacteria bacterium]